MIFLRQELHSLTTKPKKQISSAKTHQYISQIAFVFDDMFKLTLDLSFLQFAEVSTFVCYIIKFHIPIPLRNQVVIFCSVVLGYGILSTYAVYRAISIANYEHILTSGSHMAWWFEYCIGMGVNLIAGHKLEMGSRRTLALLGVAASRENNPVAVKKVPICFLPE